MKCQSNSTNTYAATVAQVDSKVFGKYFVFKLFMYLQSTILKTSIFQGKEVSKSMTKIMHDYNPLKSCYHLLGK